MMYFFLNDDEIQKLYLPVGKVFSGFSSLPSHSVLAADHSIYTTRKSLHIKATPGVLKSATRINCRSNSSENFSSVLSINRYNALSLFPFLSIPVPFLLSSKGGGL